MIRNYDSSNLKFSSYNTSPQQPTSASIDYMCSKWSVVTTIFEPSKPVRRQAELSDWCLVVVGDKKGPMSYDIANKSTLIFLAASEQMELSKRFSMISNIPWNYFGRKNVGYLYAILHGARMVWDFDDDNGLIGDMLPVDLSHYLTEGGEKGSGKAIDSDTSYEVVAYPNSTETSFNPYPLMGAPR